MPFEHCTHRTRYVTEIVNFTMKPLITLALSYFTALQYAAGLSDREGVRLSVRLSVCYSVNCDKTKAPSEKKFNYD